MAVTYFYYVGNHTPQICLLFFPTIIATEAYAPSVQHFSTLLPGNVTAKTRRHHYN
jgi:hypothetical protein